MIVICFSTLFSPSLHVSAHPPSYVSFPQDDTPTLSSSDAFAFSVVPHPPLSSVEANFALLISLFSAEVSLLLCELETQELGSELTPQPDSPPELKCW